MKKKIIIVLSLIACIGIFSASGYASDGSRTIQQQKAHEIAQLAREMGLPEDDPIILRAQELWFEDAGREQDISILARVIYWEAGNGCSEEHQLLVARVVLNRVADERFPNTVYDVVMAPRQYHPGYANGSAQYAVPSERLAEFESLARRALAGEPEAVPAGVVYQDNNRHGTGVYKTFASDFGSTTYFCYG